MESNPKRAMLPPEKVHRAVRAIELALDDEFGWVTEDHLDHLYGLLQHCSSVLLKGRFHLPFSTTAYKQAHIRKYAQVHHAWRMELVWWRTLLTNWNCVALILPLYQTVPGKYGLLAPTQDACRSLQRMSGGGGAAYGVRYQHYRFTPEEITWLTIMDLEGLVLILWMHTLCMICPEEISGKRFLSWCDNDSVVKAVQKNGSNKPTLAFIIDILHDLQSRFSFDLELKWIDTKSNRLADALSRNELNEFFVEMCKLGHSRESLVLVPVQETQRSAWSSTMRQLRQTENALLQPLAPATPPE